MKLRNSSILSRDPLLRRVWDQLGRPLGCCVTGGFVRDRLIGRPCGDLDLTIDGTTEEAEKPARQLARKIGGHAHLLGSAPQQIWRIETASLKVEIWPLGELSREEDIERRDFSCNALSWELPDGPLVDLPGGLGDLERGLLRTGRRSNLEDDPVRLLRAPRFLAQLGTFALDPATRRWIRELAPTLTRAPRARIGQELASLLRGPLAARGLRACVDLGLARFVSPAGCPAEEDWLTENLGAADRLASPRQNPLRGAMRSAGNAARLAFLIRAWGVPASGRLTPYAWPKSDRENALRAARLIDDARACVDAGAADRRELAWHAGPGFPALICLAAALEPKGSGWRRWWRQWRRDPATLVNLHRLLTGPEIAEIARIEPGPRLGTLARDLERAQVRGEIRTRKGALRWLKARIDL